MYSPRIAMPRPLVAAREQSDRSWLFLVVLALLFFYPVWPVFIEKKIGPLPSLTPQKVLNYLLIGMVLLQAAFDRNFTKRFFLRLDAARGLVGCLVAYFAWRLLAVAFSIQPFYAFKFFQYDLLTTALLFTAVVAALPERINLKWVYQAMFAAVAVVTALAIAEGIAGKNLLERFQDSQQLTLALIDKIRDGERRAQSVFASPLMLAQFCSVLLPFLWVAFRRPSSKLAATLIALLMAGCLAGIYLSRTRSALVVVLLAGGLALFFAWRRFMSDRRRNGVLRLAMGFYGGLCILLSGVVVVWALLGMARGLSIKQVVGFGDRSVTLYQGGSDARVTQLKMAWPKIVESPLVGYGDNIGGYKVGFVGSDGMLTLDSYLLRQTVDSGVPSLLFLLGAVTLAVRLALQVARQAKLNGELEVQDFAQASAAFFLGCLIFLISSPLTEMVPYFFMVMGVVLCLRARQVAEARALVSEPGAKTGATTAGIGLTKPQVIRA